MISSSFIWLSRTSSHTCTSYSPNQSFFLQIFFSNKIMGTFKSYTLFSLKNNKSMNLFFFFFKKTPFFFGLLKINAFLYKENNFFFPKIFGFLAFKKKFFKKMKTYFLFFQIFACSKEIFSSKNDESSFFQNPLFSKQNLSKKLCSFQTFPNS